jgi:hypothetical protein
VAGFIIFGYFGWRISVWLKKADEKRAQERLFADYMRNHLQRRHH